MGITAAILGSIGGLAAIYGVLVGIDVLPYRYILHAVGWEFWMAVAGILLLASIAFLVGRSGGGGEDYE